MKKDEDSVVAATLEWLDFARRESLRDPNSVLHNCTHPNYSGGWEEWSNAIAQVYLHPRTLEERLLQRQVLEILLIAVKRAFQRAYTSRAKGLGLKLELCEVYRLGSMISHVDPFSAIQIKLVLNALCQKLLNVSLFEMRSRFRELMVGEQIY